MNEERWAAAESSFRVLIIGGGIGGLCLAQGLKKSEIGVAVYERDPSAQFRSQGYRIHINAEGCHALHACLPENLFNLTIATSKRDQPGERVTFDQQLRKISSFPLPVRHTADISRTSTSVNRLALREILLAGLEDGVQFGKTFESFEQLENGSVRAYFADGTSATGDILVGADGTNSPVRKLVAPDARIARVGCRIYGKSPITAETAAWAPKAFVNGWARIAATNGLGLMVGAFVKEQSFSTATARFAPNLCLTDTPDYLMWTLTPPSGLTLDDKEFLDADAATLQGIARETTRDWHPSLKRLIEEAEITATFPVVLRFSEPVRRWEMPNVTLVGDAIHTMTPGRGEGANTALRDAELLCQKMVDVALRRVPLPQAKVQYETEMLRYGFEAVSNSLKRPFMRPVLRTS
jgi:2-polyprenyl-6-methoxyphenol hydroxylase-like FAD-dependent oxidoreductase